MQRPATFLGTALIAALAMSAPAQGAHQSQPAALAATFALSVVRGENQIPDLNDQVASSVATLRPVASKQAPYRGTMAASTWTNPYGSPSDCGTSLRVVRVSTSTELTHALSRALPGDLIWLEAGTYVGHFTASRAGTAAAHISLCGTSGVVLDGGTLNHYYTLYLDGAAYMDVRGLTVQRGLKGIMTDHWTYGTIDHVTVHNIGEEGIHLRRGSSNDTISNSRIDSTGNADLSVQPNAHHNGEGIYVGSAYTNWDALTGGAPDTSNNARILNNVISRTTAESLDLKEGTTGGLVVGNTFNGAGIDPLAADSWMDVKGNDYRISGNTGSGSPADGFQVHVQLDGWGNGNIFSGNSAAVNASGYGFRITAGSTGNAVRCDNSVTMAGSGLANVPCS